MEDTIASNVWASRPRVLSARRPFRPSRLAHSNTARRDIDAESTQTVARTSCGVVVVEQLRPVVLLPGAGPDGLSVPGLARTIDW